MMLFTVYDKKADAFMQPFFSTNEATAIRLFEAAASDQSHQFFKHAEDYVLWKTGSFDTHSGELTPIDPIPICNAFDFARRIEAAELAAEETAHLEEVI